MENNSSFFNQIKDSFEQTFQKGLSTDLWSNLSNKLEEEGLSENPLSEEISDQQIQESFETIHQQSAPNIWENIAAEIDSIPADEQLIKESFEETHQFEVPEEVWSNISSELSGTPSTEALIKDSFGATFQAQAPVHLWQQIASEVNPVSDTEALVKDSFEENYSKEAPDYIWNAVRQQINIDGVWTRLSKVLDRWKVQARRRAIAQRIASIASLLLLMHACLPTFHQGTGLPVNQQGQQKYQPMAEQIVPSTNNTQNTEQHSKNKGLPHFHQPIAKQKFGSSTQDRIQNLGNTTLRLPSATMPGKYQQPTHSFSQKFGKTRLQLPVLSPLKPTQNATQSSATIRNEEEVPHPIAENVKDTENPQQTNSGVVQNEEVESLSWINGAVAQFLSVNNSWSPIEELQSPPATNPIQNIASKSKFELGTILEAGIGFLWSEETFTGWEENSLLSTRLSPFLQFGATFNYHVNKQSAISSELFVHSRILQEISYFSSEGYYETHVDELNYLRFSLLYQHQFLRYQPKEGIENAFLVRLGGYGAFLKGQNVTNMRFQRYDAGLRFMLGHVHRWDRLSWEYGIGGNWGMYNILNGNFNLNTLQINRSNLVNFGLNTSLRYAF